VKESKVRSTNYKVFITIFTSRFVFYSFQLIFTFIIFGLLVSADSGEIEWRTFFTYFVVFWFVGMVYTVLMPWIDKSLRIGLGIFTTIMSVLYFNAL